MFPRGRADRTYRNSLGKSALAMVCEGLRVSPSDTNMCTTANTIIELASPDPYMQLAIETRRLGRGGHPEGALLHLFVTAKTQISQHYCNTHHADPRRQRRSLTHAL